MSDNPYDPYPSRARAYAEHSEPRPDTDPASMAAGALAWEQVKKAAEQIGIDAAVCRNAREAGAWHEFSGTWAEFQQTEHFREGVEVEVVNRGTAFGASLPPQRHILGPPASMGRWFAGTDRGIRWRDLRAAALAVLGES